MSPRSQALLVAAVLCGSPAAVAWDGCPQDKISCDGSCIPFDASCCGEGRFCAKGFYCGIWGHCVPAGATECANGKWCRKGFYCGVKGACVAEGSLGCPDGDVCPPRFRCGRNGGCIAEGGDDCGNGRSCPKGWQCGKSICIPEGAVDCGRRYCRQGFTCGIGQGCIPEGAVDCGDGSGTFCPAGTFCPGSQAQFQGSTAVEAGFPGVRFGQTLPEVQRGHPGGTVTKGVDVWRRPIATYQLRLDWAEYKALWVRFHFLGDVLTGVNVYLPSSNGSMVDSEKTMRHARDVMAKSYGLPDASSDIGGSYWGFSNSIIIIERQTDMPGYVVPRVEFHRNSTMAAGGSCIPNFLLLRSPEVRRLMNSAVRPEEPVDAGPAAPDAGLSPEKEP